MSTYTDHDQRTLDEASGREFDRRGDFTTPPRPEPRDAMLRAATRSLGAMVGCFRRQGDCPALVTRHDWRTWRWLCIPMGRPLSGDGA